MARRALAATLLAFSCGCAWMLPRPDASNLPEWRHQAETLRELSFTEDVNARWISDIDAERALQRDVERF